MAFLCCNVNLVSLTSENTSNLFIERSWAGPAGWLEQRAGGGNVTHMVVVTGVTMAGLIVLLLLVLFDLFITSQVDRYCVLKNVRDLLT